MVEYSCFKGTSTRVREDASSSVVISRQEDKHSGGQNDERETIKKNVCTGLGGKHTVALWGINLPE